MEIAMKKHKIKKCLTDVGLRRESSAFLRSSAEITVCGCKKVLHYAPENVRLQLSDGIMEITGEDLTAATYFGQEIKLSGRIYGIRFCKNEA